MKGCDGFLMPAYQPNIKKNAKNHDEAFRTSKVSESHNSFSISMFDTRACLRVDSTP